MNGEQQENPNYTKMSASDLLNSMGVDATKWAEAFMQLHISGGKEKRENIDFGIMLGWFANAIEAGKAYICNEPRNQH